MNFLKVDLSGGMYLEAEDWIFNHNGIKDAMKGIISMLGGNVKLGGVNTFNIAGGNLSYDEGYVAIEGEIYYVPAATVPLLGSNFYWEVVESYDPAGYEVFQDGGAPQNTYVIRTVKVATYAAAQATTATRKPLASLVTLDDRISQLFLTGNNKFTNSQNWAEKATTVAVVANAIDLTDLASNSLRVTVADGNAIQSLTNENLFNNGMWLAIHSEGNPAHRFFIAESAQIKTSNGVGYWFSAGQSVLLIKSNGKWKLMSKGDEDKGWHIVGGVGEPSFGAGVGAALDGLRFKKINNMVYIEGSVGITNKISFVSSAIYFTLPSTYRPKSFKRVVIARFDNSSYPQTDTSIVGIYENGDVKYQGDLIADNFYFQIQIPLD
jgi:hypothetical protein